MKTALAREIGTAPHLTSPHSSVVRGLLRRSRLAAGLRKWLCTGDPSPHRRVGRGAVRGGSERTPAAPTCADPGLSLVELVLPPMAEQQAGLQAAAQGCVV